METAKENKTVLPENDEPELIPSRRRGNKKRRVYHESSVDEDEQMAETTSPKSPKHVLKPITEDYNVPRLSNEDTAVTPLKAP